MTINTQTLTLDKPFVTEKGDKIKNLRLAYNAWGTLNPEKGNAVLICHALTGSSNAEDWLNGLFGRENLFDPRQDFIICINVPGSCYGSSGPADIDFQTGELTGSGFPEISVRDAVRAQQEVLDYLQIKKIRFAFGASMGGMQALEFAIMDKRIESLILVSMGKAHTAWQIGISEAQRQAIFSDPKWLNGKFLENDPPKQGLALARMQAMPWYRSAVSFEQRFGRKNQEKEQFEVSSYLNYQGKKLVERFNAVSYVRLTQLMDSHDVARGRGTYGQVLGGIEIPVLIIGVQSDLLYPINEQKELAHLIPNGVFAELDSDFGHDAFLIEFDRFFDLIQNRFPELFDHEIHEKRTVNCVQSKKQ